MAEPIPKEEISAATMIRFIASSMNGRVMVPAQSLFSHLFEQTLSHSSAAFLRLLQYCGHFIPAGILPASLSAFQS